MGSEFLGEFEQGREFPSFPSFLWSLAAKETKALTEFAIQLGPKLPENGAHNSFTLREYKNYLLHKVTKQCCYRSGSDTNTFAKVNITAM